MATSAAGLPMTATDDFADTAGDTSAPIGGVTVDAPSIYGHIDPADADDEDHLDIAFADAQRTNLEGTELARSVGLSAEPLCFPVSGTVWRTIITAADNINAGLIVTGTRGNTGLRSLMQSSVADRVLRHGRRPVLIVPPGPA